MIRPDPGACGLTALATVVLGLVGPVAGQPMNDTPPAAETPDPRIGHALVAVPGGPGLRLFGGRDEDGVERADLWAFDDSTWSLLHGGTGEAPAARSRFAMAFDSGRNRLVLHGGGSRVEEYGDTWEWDGRNWTLYGSSGPGPRSHHSMAYDADSKRIILFGGGRDENGGFLSDTWTWNGAAWERLKVEGPAGRVEYSMVGDPRGKGVYLFGGLGDGGVRFGDLWRFTDGKWSLVTDSGPDARLSAAMTAHPYRGSIFLYGGDTTDGPTGDVWSFDGARWNRLTATGPPVSQHAVAFDAGTRRVISFGGSAEGAFRRATSAWRDGSWTHVTRSSLSSPGQWIDRAGFPQYFAVIVSDLDTSITWYSSAFGLSPIGGSEADDGAWSIENLANDRLLVELIRLDAAESVARARGFFKVGFQVPDVEVVADRIFDATGNRPEVLDFEGFGIRIIQIRDPDGNLIQLSSPLDDLN